MRYGSDTDDDDMDDWTATGVSLAYSDGAVTSPADLRDLTVSRLGGSATGLPNHAVGTLTCTACSRPMYLLTQMHAPLPGGASARVLYLFGCNRHACMARPGSFVVLRAIGHPAATSISAEESGSGQQSKEAVGDTVIAPTATVHFGFGDAVDDAFGGFGNNDNGNDDAFGFGSSSSAAAVDAFGGFGTAAAPTVDHDDPNAFVVPTGDLVFQLTPSKPTASAPPPPPPAVKKAPAVATAAKNPTTTTTSTTTTTPTTTIADGLAAMSIDDVTSSESAAAQVFPALYLAFDDEYVQSKIAKAAAYAHYRMGDGMLDRPPGASSASNDRGNQDDAEGTWDAGAEGYEHTSVRGLDKHLQQFVEQVEDNPKQVARYCHRGDPLMYSERAVIHAPPAPVSADAPQRKNAPAASLGNKTVPPCGACGAPRVFEFQLMPSVLSLLPIEEFVPRPTAEEVERIGNNPRLWHRGMEFGTVLVYVCSKDCVTTSTMSEERRSHSVAVMPEVCVAQFECD
ncbi:programmed cell death protein 2 [Blastocladiella britannica]|nr:programmed cell death protein 2 [Blastocladiella britannica]